jgi:hypothetical protein
MPSPVFPVNNLMIAISVYLQELKVFHDFIQMHALYATPFAPEYGGSMFL